MTGAGDDAAAKVGSGRRSIVKGRSRCAIPSPLLLSFKMNRRLFLTYSSQAGVVAALAPLVGFPSAAATGQAATNSNAAVPPEQFPLHEATLTELQARLADGRETARSLCTHYLTRLDALDGQSPALRAVLTRNPAVLADADALDRERKAGAVRGPLHGIPVLLKDNIDTGGGLITTAGAHALARHQPAQDAFIVRQLRASGAVLLGKTNLSEWANFRSTHSASGWSGLGGQTRNPYALDRSPSGSSSGSAVAVAANLCAVAVGTETDGSIVSPASCNGIVGLKPTVGLLSRTGIIPISATQDTAGPMARTVRDAALLLDALTGADPTDAATARQPTKRPASYAALLGPDALKGQRLGVEKSHLSGPPAAAALLRDALAVLKRLGATVVEVDILTHTEGLRGEEFNVLLYEFKDGLNRYLSSAKAPVATLAEVIRFNRDHAAQALPFFQQEILEMAEKTDGLTAAAYRKAVAKTVQGARQALDAALSKQQLAAIVGVTNGPAWCIDLVNGDYSTGIDFSSPAAMAGYPHLTVPMGQAHGLPVGLSFVGPAWHEAELLAYGYAYEQATQLRRAPLFLGRIDG